MNLSLLQPETILDKDKRGQNALHYCAENQNLNCIEQIIEADPDLLNQTDEEGYTPLHLAVISGNSSIVKFLISKGADVNAVDNEKHSAIHWATGRKNLNVHKIMFVHLGQENRGALPKGLWDKVFAALNLKTELILTIKISNGFHYY